MDAKERKELESQKLKLFSKALKHMPNSPAQLKIRKEIDAIMKQLKEDIGQNVVPQRYVAKSQVIESTEMYRIYIKDSHTGKNALASSGHEYMPAKTEGEYHNIMHVIIPKYDQSRFEVTVHKNVGGHYKPIQSESSNTNIPPAIQSLIDRMIKSKIYQSIATIPNDEKHKKFMTDAEPAIKAGLLRITHDPMHSMKMRINLGPNALKKIAGEGVVNEMGKDDAVSKNIVNKYVGGNMTDKKKIAMAVIGKPYGTKDEIAKGLRDFGMEDILKLASKLGLNEADLKLPMNDKPSSPTKPNSTKKDSPDVKPETPAQKVSRAAQQLDITKRRQKIARTPSQKVSLQKTSQDQRKRLDKLKKST